MIRRKLKVDIILPCESHAEIEEGINELRSGSLPTNVLKKGQPLNATEGDIYRSELADITIAGQRKMFCKSSKHSAYQRI
jgi:hypothetical protein